MTLHRIVANVIPPEDIEFLSTGMGLGSLAESLTAKNTLSSSRVFHPPFDASWYSSRQIVGNHAD